MFIGGDTIEEAGNKALVDDFAGIDAQIGKFAVLGNWEYEGGCDLELLRRRYALAGVRLLVNETAQWTSSMHGTIRIVGLDDLRAGVPRLSLVESPETGGRSATIVLSHCPYLFDQLPPVGLLCLSGHTHGGQITPLGLVLAPSLGSGHISAAGITVVRTGGSILRLGWATAAFASDGGPAGDCPIDPAGRLLHS